MDFKKKILLVVLLLIATTGLWAKDTVIKDLYLNRAEDIIRWTNGENDDGAMSLFVSRYRKYKIVWRYQVADVLMYFNNHKIPLSAYALYGDVVTFPVTTKDKKSGKLLRQQVAIDLKRGVDLWKRDVLCGVSQQYFYSYSDGKKLYIHNLHEYKGSQFLCLDLKTGETLWEKKCLPQPSMLIDLGDSLILHSGLIREFRVFSKSDGSSRSYRTSSPVMVWGDRPVFLRLEGDRCDVLVLSKEGEEEHLFFLPASEKHDVLFFKRNSFESFFRKMEAAVVPFVLYKDSLILVMRNTDESHSLLRYSLKQKGAVLWQRNFENRIDYESMFYSNFTIPYKMSLPLLPGYPELSVFSKIEHRWIVLPIKNKRNMKGYVFLDLDSGTIVSSEKIWTEESLYIHNLSLKSGDYYYLILQQFSESEEGESFILRMSGKEGKFDSYISFPNNIFDTPSDLPKKGPIYYIMQGKGSLLKWEAINDDLKELLISDPGLPPAMFR